MKLHWSLTDYFISTRVAINLNAYRINPYKAQSNQPIWVLCRVADKYHVQNDDQKQKHPVLAKRGALPFPLIMMVNWGKNNKNHWNKIEDEKKLQISQFYCTSFACDFFPSCNAITTSI